MKTEQGFLPELNIYCFFIALLLAVLSTTTSHAQINNSKGIPSFTNYIVGDLNVAGQQVWNINQNKDGFIFVGTSSGLQKFDGRNWELLTSPISEYNTNVRATLLSSDSTFYYGSLGDFGYITTDVKGQTIETSLLKKLPEDILFNDIWSIREINEKIYFQSRKAIFIYSPDTENQESGIQIWKPDTEFMYGFSLNGVYYTHQMNLGLFHENEGVLKFIPGSDFLGKERVQVLLPYQNQGEFLVGAFSGGLFHFDGQSFNPFTTQIDSLLQQRSLYKALALPDNSYALSVLGHGFFIIDQSGNVRSQFTTKNSIPDQSVYSFYLDNTDNLWVGTNSGLSKIEIFSPLTRFDSEVYEIGNALSLNAYGNTLYIGTSTSVLYIDEADGVVKKVDGMPNSQVFGLTADDNQVLSTGSGIYKIKGNKGTLVEGTENFQTLKVLLSEKHPDYLFISGAFGIHVIRREHSSNGEYRYQSVGPISGVDRYVYTLVEDEDGEIWGGTQAGILYRIILPKTASGNLDVPNSKIEKYAEKDGIRGLSGTAVGPIDGKVYTSGIDGFYFFNKNTGSFERDSVFSFSDEVANINLDTYGLGVDQNENVFLDFKGEKRLATRKPDGSYRIQMYPFNLITASFVGSGYTEPNGIFWFGTDEGLIRLDPNMEYNVDHPVPLYFTSVFSGEETLGLPGHQAGDIPEFPFKGNQISFSYVSPFFVKENRISYQTYLEGFDDDWVKWDSNVSREFANLPYGTYTFRVRAKNTFNNISDEIGYPFVILPPWYATVWAYFLYFMGFGGLVFGLVKVQTHRVVAREKEKSREKELEQAKEIEKAYKNLKAAQEQLVQQEKLASLGHLTAGIAHEIKNPLNFVNNFSELSVELVEEAREEVKGKLSADSDQLIAILDDIEANLRKIHEHGSRADSIVKSMLQHSRGGDGVMEPTPLNPLIKEYVNLAFHGMRAGKEPINVDIDLQLDESVVEVPLIAEDFSRVILNLVNNAFDAMREKEKLTADNRQLSAEQDQRYEPRLTIRTIKNDSTITLEIQDNGPGIPEEIKDKILQPFFTTKKGTAGTGLGLSITNDIIKAHGGNLEVYSENNAGSRFVIHLSIKK